MAGKREIPDGYLMSRGYSFYVFALLFLLYMFDYIDRMVVVSLFPYLNPGFWAFGYPMRSPGIHGVLVDRGPYPFPFP